MKKILITGGASGIGKILAKKFAKDGNQVFVWDISEDNLEIVKREFEENTLKGIFMKCDVTSSEQVTNLAQKILDEYKGIDVIVNNAGIVTGKPITECSDEEINRTFEINILSHFKIIKAFLPDMIEKNSGHIVTIASAAGLIGVANLTDYCSSKFAAVGLNDSLRAEMHKYGYNIDTTLVCPYFINTGMFDGVKTRFSMFLPILSQEKAANKVYKAIKNKRKRLLFPLMVRTVEPLRAFPVGVFDFTARLFGIQSTMNQFKGRK